MNRNPRFLKNFGETFKKIWSNLRLRLGKKSIRYVTLHLIEGDACAQLRSVTEIASKSPSFHVCVNRIPIRRFSCRCKSCTVQRKHILRKGIFSSSLNNDFYTEHSRLEKMRSSFLTVKTKNLGFFTLRDEKLTKIYLSEKAKE